MRLCKTTEICKLKINNNTFKGFNIFPLNKN